MRILILILGFKGLITLKQDAKPGNFREVLKKIQKPLTSSIVQKCVIRFLARKL